MYLTKGKWMVCVCVCVWSKKNSVKVNPATFVNGEKLGYKTLEEDGSYKVAVKVVEGQRIVQSQCP